MPGSPPGDSEPMNGPKTGSISGPRALRIKDLARPDTRCMRRNVIESAARCDPLAWRPFGPYSGTRDAIADRASARPQGSTPSVG